MFPLWCGTALPGVAAALFRFLAPLEKRDGARNRRHLSNPSDGAVFIFPCAIEIE